MVKYEPQFKQLFERILKRTGIKMKAYVAVQRKALLLIYALFKNDTPYDPNYENNKEQSQKENIQSVDGIQIPPTVDACS